MPEAQIPTVPPWQPLLTEIGCVSVTEPPVKPQKKPSQGTTVPSPATGRPPPTRHPTPLRGHWDGAFTGKRTAAADLTLRAPLRPSVRGGSGSFLGSASDGSRYWVKPLNNSQSERVCATEQIVGRVGALIGAPTCEVRTIEIPPELAGWKFHGDSKLEAGIAHASLDKPTTIEIGALEKRQDDANASRHAYVLALWDLCWGGDGQWLIDAADDWRYWSHDHGWYLPPTGAGWSEAALADVLDVAHEYSCANDHINTKAVAEIVVKLRGLSDSDVVAALAPIPTSWLVSDRELESVGHFIVHRAPHVADRLQARFVEAQK